MEIGWSDDMMIITIMTKSALYKPELVFGREVSCYIKLGSAS